MIDKAAILHIPCSEYAYPLDEETFCVRLRAGRRDLVSCELYVADRACESTPIRFEGLPMERIARDERFDFFQAVFPAFVTIFACRVRRNGPIITATSSPGNWPTCRWRETG